MDNTRNLKRTRATLPLFVKVSKSLKELFHEMNWAFFGEVV